MPTYEYACQSCGAHIEVYQRFSDESLTECAVCGGKLRKVFHPAGILFKGSGFYATDSRASRKKAGGDGGGSGDSRSGSSAAGSDARADGSKGAGAESSKGSTGPDSGSSGDRSGLSKEKSGSSREKSA